MNIPWYGTKPRKDIRDDVIAGKIEPTKIPCPYCGKDMLTPLRSVRLKVEGSYCQLYKCIHYHCQRVFGIAAYLRLSYTGQKYQVNHRTVYDYVLDRSEYEEGETP